MNGFSQLCALGMLILTPMSYAVSPDNGWYAGLDFGGSYLNTVKYNLNNFLTAVPIASLSYKPGINGNAQLGYRFCDNFRIEAAITYDTNQLQSVKVGGLTIKSHQTPARANNPFNTVTSSGHTSFEALFINGYYDFFYDGSATNWVPYLGLGIGYGRLQNSIHFSNAGIDVARSDTPSTQAPIGQAIVGLSYFFTDSWSANLDLHYLITDRIKALGSRVTAETLNIGLKYSFDDPYSY